jgi:hypothetical protein
MLDFAMVLGSAAPWSGWLSAITFKVEILNVTPYSNS